MLHEKKYEHCLRHQILLCFDMFTMVKVLLMKMVRLWNFAVIFGKVWKITTKLSITAAVPPNYLGPGTSTVRSKLS